MPYALKFPHALCSHALVYAVRSCMHDFVFSGRFKVSEYLDNIDGSPLANLLLLESSAYPGYYLRWYDDGTVDCEVWL